MRFLGQFRAPASLPAIGIDICDGSLELTRVYARSENRLELGERSSIEIPNHVIVHGIIHDHKTLNRLLKQLFIEARLPFGGTASIICALPDSQVVSKLIPLHTSGRLTATYLRSVVSTSFRALGIKLPNPIYTWELRPGTHTSAPQACIYATSKSYVQQWRRFFRSNHLKLVALEMQSLALSRAMFRRFEPGEKRAILEMSYRTTSLSLFGQSGLLHTHTIEFGTRDLAALLGMLLQHPTDEAEKRTTNQGLAKLGLKEQHALRFKLEQLLEDLDMSAILKQYGSTRIAFAGAGAGILGLSQELAALLDMSITSGETWIANDLPPTIQHRYLGAIGLGIRGTDKYHLYHGINFIQ